MAKITYYMCAGASYYSCPILNKLSEVMIKVAETELTETTSTGSKKMIYSFSDEELSSLPDGNREKILWYIGYFGKKGILFNTIDTYARKLELTKDIYKLDILKMCISVFFDLWENFHESRYSFILRNEDFKKNNSSYISIDNRYKSLFSILLQEKDGDIELNKNIKFISWNYDLQLESAFRLFLADNKVNGFEELNSKYFRFKRDNKDLRLNNIFHLNGHRGFYSNFNFSNLKESTIEPEASSTIENYWNSIEDLFYSTEAQNSNFNQYIRYAWEKEQHNFESSWFKEIIRVLSETEILVVIGYSFPPFNREIDQFLFSKLDCKKVKKIVYQDPNANSQIIKNIFVSPDNFENKIVIENKNLKQFHLPNEYFIAQDLKLPMDPSLLM
jgi:hypothetical protein